MSLAQFITRVIDALYVKPVAAIVPQQLWRYGVCGVTNMTLDASWKAENCRLVIFVTCEGPESPYTENTWYVNNVVVCPLNSSVAYQYK